MVSYGQASRGPLRGMNPVVTLAAAAVLLATIVLLVLLPEASVARLSALRTAVAPTLDWYYVALVAFLLVFVIWLGVGRYKNVRLGPEDERPEFALVPWIAMLFAAGTGVGLLFWSIAEPVLHFEQNPFDEGRGPASAVRGLALAFFHWGLNGWAIFSLVGAALAYFGFRRNLPLAMRSILQPLIGSRIHGPAGHAVDVFAVVATIFGLATTLGLGARQMNVGLARLADVPIGIGTQMLLIAVVTGVAIGSVVSGVRRGVRRLSELNVALSLLLLAVFFVAGPTATVCALLIQATGEYLDTLLRMSFWTGVSEDPGWHTEWTVFFWGWWISWAPFVGMFIARISRGRTLREFVLGVLVVPTLVTLVWIAVLGGTALHYEMTGAAAILEAVREDVTVALYTTIEALPLPGAGIAFTSGLATLLIGVYFVTSADSGTLVATTLMAYGDPEPPRLQRVVWGATGGVLTAVLLLAGGIAALQDAVILAAIPFSFVMLVMSAGLVQGLRSERFAPVEGRKKRLSTELWTGVDEAA